MNIILEHAACFFSQRFAMVANTLDVVDGVQKPCMANGKTGIKLGGAHFRQIIGDFSLEGVHYGLVLQYIFNLFRIKVLDGLHT